MRKLTLFIAVLLFGLASAVSAKTITGRVLESKTGEPVIGATVLVKGTSNGTITDYDGNFTINCEDKAILKISYTSMKTQEVPAVNGMVVKMTEDSQLIEAVVVTAYGTSTKKSITGSATVVKGEDIEKKNPSEITKALAGEVAGVQVIQSSGQPGTSATIRIQGIGSVNSSSAPLIVVDGMPYEGDLSSIDPGDIASTTVLKDATATSLYGARASNGVLLITTKKGTKGEEGKIIVDIKTGINTRLLPLYDFVTSPQEYVELTYKGMYTHYRYVNGLSHDKSAELSSNRLFSGTGLPKYYNRWSPTPGNQLINPATGKFYVDRSGQLEAQEQAGYRGTESWQDAMFHVGKKLNANVKIHGGSDKTTYYTSFGYLNDEGYYIGSDYSRFSARSNITHQAKKWLKGTVNMAYSYSELNNPGQRGGGTMNNGFKFVNTIPAIYPVYQHDKDGNIVLDPTMPNGKAYDYGEGEAQRPYGYGINPAGALQLDKQRTLGHQFTGNTSLEFLFTKDLTLTVNLGAQYYGSASASLTNKYYGDAAGVGRINQTWDQQLAITSNQLLRYKHQFGDHSVNAFLGHEMNYTDYRYMYASKKYTVRPEGLELGNAIQVSGADSDHSENAIQSFFGQVRYNYEEKYFANVSMRRDGSSRFAEGKRWGNFGALGLGWLISSEEFMESTSEWLRSLKLKASYGVLGNQSVPAFAYTDLYTMGNVNGRASLLWARQGNPDLTWEVSHKANIGFEATFSKYLDLEVNYFNKKTTDMMFARSVAPSLGYSSYYVNEGEMVVSGAEFQATIHAVDNNNFKLNIRVNGARYRDEITEMPLEADGKRQQVISGSMSKGHSLYDYYMPEFLGVNPDNGSALYRAAYDKNEFPNGPTDKDKNAWITSLVTYKAKHPKADIVYTETENSSQAMNNYIGKSALPDLAGGFGFDIETYGFDISASFQYGIGGYGYDGVYAMLMGSDEPGKTNYHKDIQGAWSKPGDKTDIPRMDDGSYLYANSYSSRFLTSNTYLNLSNVRIGYTFPKKWLEVAKINSMNVFVSGDNLFCLSARKGYMPFSSFTGGSSDSQYMPLSTLMAGIKFTF